MGKNIVICSDGTGNTAMKGRGTNVFKLFEAVDVHNKDTRQVAIYDDGVGTQSFSPLRLISGAIGLGLKRNVIRLYTELAHVYNPGDKIFLFGFSRGAFTVRTLAGLIYHCGILDHDCPGEPVCTEAILKARAKAAYRAYRCRYKAWLEQIFCFVMGWLPFFKACCKKESTNGIIKDYALKHDLLNSYKAVTDKKAIPDIEFIGAWDTVSAMGFPVMWMSEFVDKVIYKFHFPDKILNENVKYACHALSIDDERQTFHPLLWKETEEDKSRIEQVWFTGVHANVGGGYPKHGISLISLEWMLHKAEQSGLRVFEQDHLKFIQHDKENYIAHRNVTDKLYNSRSGIKEIYRYKPRKIGWLCDHHNTIPKVHVSTFYRIAQCTDGYAPGNLPNNLEIVYSDGRIYKPCIISKITKNGTEKPTSLLDEVDHLINLRRFCHFTCLFILFGLLGIWLYEAHSQGEFWDSVFSLFSIKGLLVFLGDIIREYWWLLLTALIAYLLGRWAKSEMDDHFSKYWHSKLKKLRSIFNITDEDVNIPAEIENHCLERSLTDGTRK